MNNITGNEMTDIDPQQLTEVEGGDFWNPFYAAAYAVGYAAGAYCRAVGEAYSSYGVDATLSM